MKAEERGPVVTSGGGRAGRPGLRVGLVTWSGLPELSDDDRGLLRALSDRGATAAPVTWGDPAGRADEYDLLVVRSTWDYHLHRPEFLEWVDRIANGPRVWNPPEVLRWNSHKSYLLDLEARGVPVVPTRFCEDASGVPAILEREGWERAVVKPAVSAGGYRTFVIDPRTAADPSGPWRSPGAEPGLLVQPYVPEVEGSGERSLVFLGEEYSHAFLRAPRFAPASGLKEGSPIDPAAEELRVARAALRAAPGPTLYARVDLVADPPRLMELELIEPALELRLRPGAAEQFAETMLRAR
jgi:hypothetical protein